MFFQCFDKIGAKLNHVFFGFHEKNMDFLAKNDHFSNFDKMAGNDRIRLLYSSKDQEFANEARNKC